MIHGPVPPGAREVRSRDEVTETFAVFGAGAVGCWFGGMLAAGGAEVTLIGRARVMADAELVRAAEAGGRRDFAADELVARVGA